MPDDSNEKLDLLQRLARIRGLICPYRKYESEVERCPCVRGGHDVNRENGPQTGCKDIQGASNRIEHNT
jgi:hypothetical protein